MALQIMTADGWKNIVDTQSIKPSDHVETLEQAGKTLTARGVPFRPLEPYTHLKPGSKSRAFAELLYQLDSKYNEDREAIKRQILKFGH